MNSTTDLRLKVLSKIYCSCTHNFYKVWRYSSEFPITYQNYHARSTTSKSWAFLDLQGPHLTITILSTPNWREKWLYSSPKIIQLDWTPVPLYPQICENASWPYGAPVRLLVCPDIILKPTRTGRQKYCNPRREKKKSFPLNCLPRKYSYGFIRRSSLTNVLGNERVTKPLRLSAWKASFLNSLPRNKCETEGRRLGVRTVQNDHSAIERTVYIDVVLYSVKPYNFEALCPINTVMCPKEVLELNILSSSYYCLTPDT